MGSRDEVDGFSRVEMGSILSVLRPLNATSCATTERKRRLVANVCRMIGEELMDPRRKPAPAAPLIPETNGRRAANARNGAVRTVTRPLTPLRGVPHSRFNLPVNRLSPDDRSDDALSPRLHQTLQLLLTGESEKQVAKHLGLSRHTVHVYVKKLYRRYDVSSRGELLAKWVTTS